MGSEILNVAPMGIQIALLRGINVGGKNTLPMSTLKKLVTQSGQRQVVTYLNSGNVVFESDGMKPLATAERLEKMIHEKFGFPVMTLVLSLDEIRKSLEACPFDAHSLDANENIYFTYLTGIPRKEAIDRLKSFSDETDDCVVRGRVVYVLVKRGYTKTLYNNNFVERTLEVGATTRNINTVGKIAEIGLRLLRGGD